MSWDIFSKSKIQYFLQKLKDKFVQKETGKGLSTNDFDNTYKSKVDKIDVSLSSISGNPISISGLKANQLAVNPIITLEPIQDLHGQSKPYPAGGGKNILPTTVDNIKDWNTAGTWTGNVYVYNGVTYTILTDDANNVIGIKVNGTASANSGLRISGNASTFLTDGVSYKMKGCPSESTVSTYYFVLATTFDSGRSVYEYGLGATFTYTASSYANKQFYIGIWEGYNASDLMYYPMVSVSTGSTYPDFEPYSNICPISGYDKIEVSSGGKNIFDISKVIQNSTISVSGNSISKAQSAYYGDIFSGNFGQGQPSAKKLYLPKGTYTVSYTSSASTNLFIDLIDDSTLAPTFEVNFNASSGLFTMPRNGYVCIKIASNVANTISNLQIELGSSATTYEPYKSATSISESLGQTVYWGELDVRSGKFKVIGQIVDMGDIAWSYWSGTQTFFATFSGYAYKSNVRAVCENYNYIGTVEGVGGCNDGECALFYKSGESTRRIYAKDTNYSDAPTFKTAVTGVKFVYELESPFYIQLTPHEISILKDYAYVSTNGTTIVLDYHNGELASLADVSQLGETVNELGFSLIAFNVPIAGETISNGYKNLYTTIDVNSYTPITLIEQNPWNEKCTFTLAYTNKAVISIHIRCTEASYTIPSNIAPLTVLCIPNKKIINPIK